MRRARPALPLLAGLLLLLGAPPGTVPARAAGDEAAIQAYFDTYNAAIAETPWDGTGPRQVTWVMKVTAFERDNWRCVLCGSEGPLELDHARALMNGGDNTLENLHTLCHDCHVAKTRLDFALRRHRQSLTPDTLPPDPEAASETLHAREPSP